LKAPVQKAFVVFAVAFCTLSLVPISPLFSAGTFADGWAIVRVTRLENKGIVYRSYEGVLEWVGFDPDEKCDAATEECFLPILESRAFSLREDQSKLIRFIGENLNREMLVHYQIHRVTALKLSTDFEILEAYEISRRLPAGFPEKKLVEQTGDKRNFSVKGKFLKIERKGTAIKTYEIVYYNREKDRVHPASITDRDMAEFAIQTMHFDIEFFFGVSESFVKGVRESTYDIFEINYKGRAGLGG
jgi:hypothetical protein